MKLFIITIFVGTLLMACQQKESASCCSMSTQPKNEKEVTKLPETSLYQLDDAWQTQKGKELKLEEFAGKPTVITMIFTHCEYACPMMVSDLKAVESQFTAEERNKFQFVLVSFDHIRDTPERLATYAAAQKLGDNWTLLHGSADQIKELGVLLNISFEQLENMQFAHANHKTILDKTGTIVYSIEGLETGREEIASELRKVW